MPARPGHLSLAHVSPHPTQRLGHSHPVWQLVTVPRELGQGQRHLRPWGRGLLGWAGDLGGIKACSPAGLPGVRAPWEPTQRALGLMSQPLQGPLAMLGCEGRGRGAYGTGAGEHLMGICGGQIVSWHPRGRWGRSGLLPAPHARPWRGAPGGYMHSPGDSESASQGSRLFADRLRRLDVLCSG